MTSLIHPTYFASISHFVVMAQSQEVCLEMEDNYQKQTYRNRTFIYGANGKLQLSVPVTYTQKNRQKYRDIKIFNAENWQLHHWKSLESAYRTSPFFEFYEDELYPLFKKKETYLLDFNLKCLETVCSCLDMPLKTTKTKTYEKNSSNELDFRYLANSKNHFINNFDAYFQVFSAKHGFINNLSILDLLFNEGTNALMYLQAQKKP